MIAKNFRVVGNPVSKPRMTRADVWRKRTIVIVYRAWADAIRTAAFGNAATYIAAENIVEKVVLKFYLPIPDHLKKKVFPEMPHNLRPDIDNLAKGALDALFIKDSIVPSLECHKYYSETPRLVVDLFFAEENIRTSEIERGD